MNPFKDYMTVTEAADYLGFNRDYVRRMIRAGKLKAFAFGIEWAVPRAEVEQYKLSRVGVSKHNPHDQRVAA